MPLSFIEPRYLWLLLLLLPFGALTLFAPNRMPRWRLWSSLGLRTLIFVALVFALVGTQWVGVADHLTTVFVIDSSDSISPHARAKAEAYVQTALSRMPMGDRAAVIVFGKEPLVERAPSDSRQWVRLTVAPPGSYTDIEHALQLALAILPAETRKRVVLLSDGGENRGQAMHVATLARAAQVPIETISLQGPPPAGDIVLEAVEAPSRARSGQALRLMIQARAPQATTGHLRLLLDRLPVFDGQVELQPNLNRIPITVPAPNTGFHTWEAHLDATGDTVSANNVGFGFSTVQGLPKIAIVEGVPGRGSNLAAALQASHMQVEALAPAALPASLISLDAYAAVVLVDVPYQSLPPAAARLLPAYVRELGHGLLMVGGADSYAAGGYLNTPIEGALPVTMRTRTVKIRPDVALVLIIDHSGSMAGDKLDLAREGAVQAFTALDDTDQIGVIQFDTTAEWVVPLQKRPLSDSFVTDLKRIGVGGGTDLRPGLVEAATVLEKAQARIKHVVLLTDGQADRNYDDVVTRLKGDGITLSAVGVGPDYDPHLKDIAPLSGGRFYEARNFADIPALFFDETLRISRRGIVEHDFAPTLSFPAAALHDISAVPPLHGYNAVTAKPTAQVVLQSDENDPILAQWQYGLGRAAAWTSDMHGQWGGDWVGWNGFGRFAGQLVESLLPVPATAGWEASTHVEGAALVLNLRADGLDNQPRTGLHPTGRLIASDGRVIDVPLSEVTPGRYRATIGLPDAGVYQTQVVATNPTGQIEGFAQTGAVIPPSAEYLQRDGNVGLLQALAQTTGGHFGPQPNDAWSLPPATTRRTIPITWPLLSLAILLWPLDIALRRLLLPPFSTLRARLRRSPTVTPTLPHFHNRLRSTLPPQPNAPNSSPSPNQSKPSTPRRSNATTSPSQFDWRSTRRTRVERLDDRDSQ